MTSWFSAVALLGLLVVPSSALAGDKKLTGQQAQKLILVTPDALRVRDAGGCPRSELVDLDGNSAHLQLRNRCPREGSGMVGNFTVDRLTGRVWFGIDKDTEIDSRQLRELRRKLLKKTETPGEKKDN